MTNDNLLSQNFFRVSPGFCFADGLASLALLRQGMKDNSSKGDFDWNVTGASLLYLGVEVFLILILEAFRMLFSFSKTNKKIFVRKVDAYFSTYHKCMLEFTHVLNMSLQTLF